MKAEDIQLVCTCQVCPEQYDAFDKWGTEIGYLHLRNGFFTARNNDNEIIYSDKIDESSGSFSCEEREGYLMLAKEAMAKYYTERMGDIKMKTFKDLYEFAQHHRGIRVPLRSINHELSCYNMHIYGSGDVIIIEGPSAYQTNTHNVPLFRITYYPEDELVCFNDMNDSGCDVVLNQHCLPIDAVILKMKDFAIVRTVVLYLLTGFGE